ncbi:MAG: DUF4974 domain-containing protein [Bacteroidales bacterium]|nr:DUF4974 domain-containing protein [Bacteroidales bacterium]
MNDDILIRYIQGKLSEAEREAVVAWIEEDPANRARFERLQLDDTFSGLQLPELSEEEAVERLAAAGWPGEASGRRVAVRWLRILTRVAAILLIPLAVAGALVIGKKNAEIARLNTAMTAERVVPIQEDASWLYTVNSGVKGDVTLPDGSRVRLNSASTLRCPDRFAAESRVVELSGEGFFEVVGNPDWPMYVKTAKGVTVKVTGTKFNVSAYENDTAMKLTLVEGNVTVIHDATDRQYAVRPNEEMVFYGQDKAAPVKKEVDVQPAIAWKDGILLFENMPMPEVVKRLERWYGVFITVQDPSIMAMNFTASFESESLSQVLQLLRITSQIDYRIDGRQVFLSRK